MHRLKTNFFKAVQYDGTNRWELPFDPDVTVVGDEYIGRWFFTTPWPPFKFMVDDWLFNQYFEELPNNSLESRVEELEDLLSHISILSKHHYKIMT